MEKPACSLWFVLNCYFFLTPSLQPNFRICLEGVLKLELKAHLNISVNTRSLSLPNWACHIEFFSKYHRATQECCKSLFSTPKVLLVGILPKSLLLSDKKKVSHLTHVFLLSSQTKRKQSLLSQFNGEKTFECMHASTSALLTDTSVCVWIGPKLRSTQ